MTETKNSEKRIDRTPPASQLPEGWNLASLGSFSGDALADSVAQRASVDFALDDPLLEKEHTALRQQLEANKDLREFYKQVAAIPCGFKEGGEQIMDQNQIDAKQKEALQKRVEATAEKPYEEQVAEARRIASHVSLLVQAIERRGGSV